MLKYLLVEIPSLLFESIAVVACLGLVAALLVYRKKHNRFYWSIILCIILMLAWRLFCHSIMVSSRYSSILLYPAVICTGWFCLYSRNIVRGLFNSFSHMNDRQINRISDIMPFILISGLSAAGLVKILQYNPYGNHTIKICKTSAL